MTFLPVEKNGEVPQFSPMYIILWVFVNLHFDKSFSTNGDWHLGSDGVGCWVPYYFLQFSPKEMSTLKRYKRDPLDSFDVLCTHGEENDWNLLANVESSNLAFLPSNSPQKGLIAWLSYGNVKQSDLSRNSDLSLINQRFLWNLRRIPVTVIKQRRKNNEQQTHRQPTANLLVFAEPRSLFHIISLRALSPRIPHFWLSTSWPLDSEYDSRIPLPTYCIVNRFKTS